MDEFDAALVSPEASELLGQINRLYQVAYGRPPDPSGLRAYLVHMQSGLSLRNAASIFLSSEEFRRCVRERDPAEFLYCNAGLDRCAIAQGAEISCPLDEVAVALVQSPDLAARMPLLPSLYPDGVSWHDASDYRIWLAGRLPLPSPQPTISISLLVSAMNSELAGVEKAVVQALSIPSSGVELLVVGWRFGVQLAQFARSNRGVRLVRIPPWFDQRKTLAKGLSQCRGTFCALIAPGQSLDCRLAAVVASAAPDADIVICDDDAMDEHGLRHSPQFGAAWDAERVIAAGPPGLVLFRTSVLQTTAALCSGDPDLYDLLLSASRLISPERILHLPSVLLSRRQPAGWEAGPSQVEVAQEHLQATGRNGCTVVTHRGTLRIIYPLPPTLPRASIIIATRDRAELLGRCLDGLLHRTDYPDIEVLIVDNGSTDPVALNLLQELARDGRVRVLSQPGPFNWSALSNFGVGQMSGEIAVLLNNDTDIIDPAWLRELVSQALRPDVGAVGAMLLYPDGTVQHAGVILTPSDHALHIWKGMPGDARGYRDALIVTREVTAVTGACLATRRDVYERIGGCDAEHLPVTWNDVDYCLRVRELGLRVIWTPHARLLHLEQASRGSDDLPDNQARFRREQAVMKARWGTVLRTDPFHSPNLYPDETGSRLAVVFGAGSS